MVDEVSTKPSTDSSTKASSESITDESIEAPEVAEPPAVSNEVIKESTNVTVIEPRADEERILVTDIGSVDEPVSQLPEITLTYEPIYYSSGQDLVTERNFDNLQLITKTLQEYPSLNLELIGHSSAEGIIEYKLFSSLKIAERLKRHFMNEGIDGARIFIKGVGDNYPMVIQNEDEPQISKYTKFNSRVEVKFSEYQKEVSQLHRQSPEIPVYAQDQTHELYATLLEDAITYKISIAIVGQMYRSKTLDLFNDTSVEEDRTTGLYTYTIGLYDNYAEATRVKRDIERLGITDAKVIAYYDGRRLTEEEYVYYVNDFPDLRGLMNDLD